MNAADIVSFAVAELEAVPERFEGNTYRCAASLAGGVFLPCVLLVSREKRVEWAVQNILRRITDAEKPVGERRFGKGMGVPNLIDLYAASGNRLDSHYIVRIDHCPHSLPVEHIPTLSEETSMAGTQFVATMADGKMFAFFTTGDRLFFEMPEGYTGKDIVSVHPHQTLPGKVYQMMPFFTCYVNGLDF